MTTATEEVLILITEPFGEAAAATSQRADLMKRVIEKAKEMDPAHVVVLNPPDATSSVARISCPVEMKGELRKAFSNVTFAGERAVESLYQTVMSMKPSAPGM